MNEYLKKKKWEIMIFLIFFITLSIISCVLNGGPKSTGGPLGVFLGFCLVQLLKYRQFQKEMKNHHKLE
ncbi:hypothetical protein QUF51_01140 [Bacillus pumilus]|nr:hypothetical protein [Bacillus pumilus]